MNKYKITVELMSNIFTMSVLDKKPKNLGQCQIITTRTIKTDMKPEEMINFYIMLGPTDAGKVIACELESKE